MCKEKLQAGHVAVVYSKNYQISFIGLENLHPFDIHKYAKIHKQLVKDNLFKARDVHKPKPITKEDILLVHSQEFLDSLKRSQTVAKYLEAPMVKFFPSGIVDHCALRPFRYASGGTLLAARKALESGIAINIGGGYHHAKPDNGEGFCIYADMPIAIRKLQNEGRISSVLIIDLDVHQGNGTVVCLANDDSTFTFSMHQGDIYPIPKEQSDLDIELDSGIGDRKYLRILLKHLPKLFELAKPNIVFYQAGCDTLADDPLASLNMTEQGIVNRDAKVVEACVLRGIPVVMTTGGGYSKNAWHAQYSSIRNIIEIYGLAGARNETGIRKDTIKLLRKVGLKEELDAGVKISSEESGVISIADEGSFLMQYMIMEPNVSADANLIVDPNIKIPSSCKNVVIVTHGWIDKAGNDWPADVAGEIRKKVDPNEWICAFFDWRGGAAVLNPIDAAKYARDIAGQRLAKAILELGKFEHIHLIGHSAGCWAINGAAKIIAKKADANIHLTFLDAYVPPFWQESELGKIESEKIVWAEHYYTKDITLSCTGKNLSTAHNADITQIDPFFAEHKFPYRWYYATVAGKYRDSDWEAGDKVLTKYKGLDYGFARSLEAGRINWEKSITLQKGNEAVKLKKPEKKKLFNLKFFK
ncbi:MAG: hypothetical protein KAS69_04860 [Planctomycetes bacterium]|nr:hypothetical protein [Planctomycetota bacterium]